MTKIIVHDTENQLGKAMAEDILRLYRARKSVFLLGCPGGRTPKPIYAAMAEMIRAEGLDLSDLVIVMMDDYVLQTGEQFDHVDGKAHYSCRRFAREDILAVLNKNLPEEKQISPERLWFPNPRDPAAYEAQLSEAGGIDYFILASGAGDGHVAFNPPGSAKSSTTRVIELAEQTRRDNLATFPEFNGINAVPRYGVTVGIKTIYGRSKRAALALWGADKGYALAKIQAANAYDENWPATVIHESCGAQVHVDHSAFEAAKGFVT